MSQEGCDVALEETVAVNVTEVPAGMEAGVGETEMVAGVPEPELVLLPPAPQPMIAVVEITVRKVRNARDACIMVTASQNGELRGA